jgi:phosphatidylethanolamine/phosphatidyl-N-methylethanolamine N-methyltransferase
VRVLERHAMLPLGHFSLIRFQRLAAGANGRILDVGIGTGISLTDYAPTHRIVGVDYCEPMLRKAHERVAEHNLAHVEALAVMDAQHLGFPDAFFAVVAQYVITTVPDPEAALDELPA